MNFYTLEAVVKGKNVNFTKTFESRDDAINYMMKYYNKHFIYGLEVNEEVSIDGNKHNVEYICNHSDRFTINRVTL